MDIIGDKENPFGQVRYNLEILLKKGRTDVTEVTDILTAAGTDYGVYAGVFYNLTTGLLDKINDLDILVFDSDIDSLQRLFPNDDTVVEPNKGTFFRHKSEGIIGIEFMMKATLGEENVPFVLTATMVEHFEKVTTSKGDVMFCNPFDTILFYSILQRGGQSGKDLTRARRLAAEYNELIDPKYVRERLQEVKPPSETIAALSQLGFSIS